MSNRSKPPTTPNRPGPTGEYFSTTRGPWYGYLFALPILAGYEVLEFLFKPDWAHTVNLADAVLTSVLTRLFGALGMGTGARFQMILIVLVAAGIFCWRADAARRGEGRPLRPRYFAYMLLESAVYAVFFAPAVLKIQGLLTSDALLQLGGAPGGVFYRLAMSLGAGIYEELLFRVLIMGGLYLLLHRIAKLDIYVAWVVAAACSAVAFSAFHYVGPGAYPFTFESFLFRAIAGALFAALYGARGFGIVVWTHALYDVLVLFLAPGG